MMDMISELMDSIEDELKDATGYAMYAAQYKNTDKALADAFTDGAESRLNTVKAMHTCLLRRMQEMKSDRPEEVQRVFQWMHNRVSKHIAETKTLIEMQR